MAVLRFRLGSIPVIVHPVHFLGGLFLGFLWSERAADPEARMTMIVLWVVVVFVSALVHELGHALAYRAFGYQPVIQLVALGGVTTTSTDVPLPFGRDVVTTLAGPTAGALLGLACLWLSRVVTAPSVVEGLEIGAGANIVWAVFNLFPILPLDGGRVSQTVLGRLFGRSGLIAAYALGVLTCAVGALAGYRFLGAGPITLVFLLLFGWQNLQALLSAWRSGPEAAAPAQLLEAERLFRSDQLGPARDQASALLRDDLPVSVRSRIHHLLGWIALKEGEGRRALEEFRQVQGNVEPQAIAAAHSLIGDDAGAIPLWEEAARRTRDPNVLHEWAGALIRRGDVQAASAIPGVDMATAFEFAERVAFLRGAYSEAARFGEESLARRPSAARAYDVACAYARAGDVRRALTLLARARELGYSDREAAAADPDLVSLAGEPAFQEWLASLGKSAAS